MAKHLKPNTPIIHRDGQDEGGLEPPIDELRDSGIGELKPEHQSWTPKLIY
jgi:hypothetical protein